MAPPPVIHLSQRQRLTLLRMRLLTWNINGVRTLPQYHPWNSLQGFDGILRHLDADIICLQEMKSGRRLLSQDIAVPASFDAFFSFPRRKTGYSGVATYTRVRPLKAEEGLSGLLQPTPPLSSQERISGLLTYPPHLIEELGSVDEDEEQPDYITLDGEGRAVVLDFGLFVLVNTYCPNDGSGTEERGKFKMDYHRMLEMRVKALIEQENREVIVVGDLNACAAVIDHCEGDIMVAKGLADGLEGQDGFWGKRPRRWLRAWLQNEDGTGGSMVDTVRRFWPHRKGMYTCWNTKLSARETNYGTRIDFILVTPGLVPWIKAGDIQPDVKGSDHCPVHIDFHDQIIDKEGAVVHLRDVLGAQSTNGKPADPPRLAARFWEEFSTKQTSLQQFFGGPPKVSSALTTPQATPLPSSLPNTPTPSVASPCDLEPETVPLISTPQGVAPQAGSFDEKNPPKPSPTAQTSSKRKLVLESSSGQKEPKKKKKGQQTIASFFAKPSTSTSLSSSSKSKPSARKVHSDTPLAAIDVDMQDEDYKLALQLSQEQDTASSQNGKNKEQSKQTWTALLAPLAPPNCTGHDEPAKELKVNKAGPNKGKKFFICSRPVGPGYDKGKAERMREHVDPQYRCDFFKWSSDVKKNMMDAYFGS